MLFTNVEHWGKVRVATGAQRKERLNSPVTEVSVGSLYLLLSFFLHQCLVYRNGVSVAALKQPAVPSRDKP